MRRRTRPRRVRRKGASHARKHLVPLYTLPERHTSYETALLKSIVSGRDSSKVSKHALMFYSLLADTTPSTRALNYRHGIAIGRSLYLLYARARNYSLYEESVADLVSFFENAGCGRVTYNALPHMVRIGMPDMLHLSLGMNIHMFEAGLIAGFLTASKGQITHVFEKTCSSNSATSCEFYSSITAYGEDSNSAKDAFDAFVEEASRRVSSKEPQYERSITNEYYVLSSLVLLDSKYFNEMRAIANYLGSRLAANLGLEIMTPRRMFKAVERSVELLNLGIEGIKVSGTDITLKFGKLHSRKAFADLSVAFLHGLLRNSLKGADIRVKGLISNGAYSVRLSMGKPAKG